MQQCCYSGQWKQYRLIEYKKSLQIPKGQSESVYRRRTEHNGQKKKYNEYPLIIKLHNITYRELRFLIHAVLLNLMERKFRIYNLFQIQIYTLIYLEIKKKRFAVSMNFNSGF